MPGYYPPKLMGMRGSHPGSFEAAHLLRDGKIFETVDSKESYDLVVVGAGISGLSAAYFYQKNIYFSLFFEARITSFPNFPARVTTTIHAKEV